MKKEQVKTLVLGIGNLLLADEGVGVHATRALDDLYEAEVLEIGTAILDALPALEKAEKVIVIDAMQAQGTPGTIYRIPFEDCEGAHSIASMHGFDLSRVLAFTNRIDTPDVVVFGVEPAHIHWAMELSSQVTEALPFLLKAVRNEVEITA